MKGTNLYSKKVGIGAIALFLSAGGAFMACSGPEEDNQENGEITCSESDDCEEGLICSEEGICVEEEEDQTAVIEEEDYLVSFWARRAAGLGDRTAVFNVAGSRDGSVEELLTDEFECVSARDCGATEDFQYFLQINTAGEAFTVTVASIDRGSMSLGSPELWLEDVYNPRIRGNGLIYEVIEDGRFVGYYHEPGGSPQQVASLAQVNSNIGRFWDADPNADRAIVFLPTLETVEIWIGSISAGVNASNRVTELGRENLPGSAGSFYLGQLPAAFSPDGRFVAVSTVGPNAHGSCVVNDDCTGTSHVCGTNDRCVAIEATVHIFDMESLNTLGDPCADHARCGDVHRCDSATPDFADGVCKPQRVIIGVPNQPSQSGQTGCIATRADGTRTYTDIRAPMSFGPDGQLYFVGQRNCVAGSPSGDDTEANIPKSAILAANPADGTFVEVFGNPEGENFSDAKCYDEIENQIDVTDCVTMIHSARLSPEGNDLVFMATNPSVTSPANASRVFDVWRVRRDGEDHSWIGNTSQVLLLDSFRVHRDE